MVTKIQQKIKGYVKRGYKEAAFTKQKNAEYFKQEWRKKGYKTGTIRSTGVTVEYPKQATRNAYYVIAQKKKARTEKPRHKRVNRTSYIKMWI